MAPAVAGLANFTCVEYVIGLYSPRALDLSRVTGPRALFTDKWLALNGQQFDEFFVQVGTPGIPFPAALLGSWSAFSSESNAAGLTRCLPTQLLLASAGPLPQNDFV